MWRVGHKPVRISKRPAAFADFGTNVLVLRGSDGRWGFTRLSAPGRFRWQAHFRPLRLSPDGRRIVGFVQHEYKGRWVDSAGVFQVRRVSDGKVLMAVQAGTHSIWPHIGWDGNKAIFFADAGGTQHALVRCGIGVGCRRATDVADRVTVPFTLHLY